MAARPYVEPTGNQTSGMLELFQYVNGTADGLFVPAMLLVIWITIFLSTKQFKSSVAWTTASAMCAFLSIPLAILDLVAPRYMYLCIVLASVGALWLKLEK